MKISFPLLIISALLASGGAARAASTNANESTKLRVMSYNVENLFDAEHDTGKQDWTFLPKSYPEKEKQCNASNADAPANCLNTDWTAAKVDLKIAQIKKALAATGKSPDVLSLIEVENEAIVQRLARELGYDKVLITNSPDERGIDVALIYRSSAALSLIRWQEISVNLAPIGGKPSRDLLIAEFTLGAQQKDRLAIIVNHWPSQNNKTPSRRIVADKVRELATEYIQNGFKVLALGDFNVEPSRDQPSPFLAFENPSESTSLLFDIDRLARQNAKTLGLDVSLFPPGTYFFATPGGTSQSPIMTWNMLDRFFVSEDLLKQVDLASYRILNPPLLTTEVVVMAGPLAGSRISGAPKAYSNAATTPDEAGYSDHFPIYVEFSLK